MLLSGCTCATDKLVGAPNPECGEPCYPEGYAHRKIGACTSGTLVCSEIDDYSPECIGFGIPDKEVCDNIDNDCDGLTDQFWKNCSTTCGHGVAFCQRGIWSECTADKPAPEICNGKDDDCDGVADNVQYSSPYCYTGPAQTAAVGECRPGVSRCSFGQYVCAGQTVPRTELCDGRDDDCDNVVDEDFGGLKQVSFIFDNSCSMQPYQNCVRSAVNTWSNKYFDRADIQVSVIWAPSPDLNDEEKIILHSNFVSVSNMASLIQPLSVAGSGWEATYDAIAMTSVQSANPLGLTWAYGAKKAIIMFADEAGDSSERYNVPKLTQQTTLPYVLSGPDKMPVYVFTSPWAKASYLDIVTQSGGEYTDIMSQCEAISQQLDDILQKLTCQ
jgi:Putative metal-binding motif